MKVIVSDLYTEIFPDEEEIKNLCQIGKGPETCVWLICGRKGFECTYYDKPISLLLRWREGETTAKRDGCDKVKGLHKDN